MKYPSIKDRLIVFEGIDGAGKSTQMHLVAHELKKNMTVATTNAPYNGMIGTCIRKILKDPSFLAYNFDETSYMRSTILSYMFAADRCEHLYSQDGIFSQLDTHDIVLCDRYFFSSIAYQGESRRLREITTLINEDFPLPQILVYFQLPPHVAMSRIGQGKEKDYLETLEILKGASERYEELLEEYESIFSTHTSHNTMHIIRVDATKPQETLTSEILQRVHTYFPNHPPS